MISSETQNYLMSNLQERHITTISSTVSFLRSKVNFFILVSQSCGQNLEGFGFGQSKAYTFAIHPNLNRVFNELWPRL